MTFYFVLNHPAHFHLFKNTILELQLANHLCKIFIRPKDVLIDLLVENNFKYKVLTTEKKRKNLILLKTIIGLLRKDFFLFREVHKQKPDLLIGTDWSIVHVGKLYNIPSLVFNEDDTTATPENKYFYPLAGTLVLPDICDKGLWRDKRVSYKGYHELAYLHPKRFHYNFKKISELIGQKKYLIIRLVKLTASHDSGKKGLGKKILGEIIDKYSSEYKILISFEENEIKEFQEYGYRFPASLMHHFLAGADLVIGDSQTMIAEAAVLGTPAIRFNDFVGKLSYLEELEKKYELTYGFKTNESQSMLLKIDELLSRRNLKKEWLDRRNKMLSDKIDVTAFMVWLLEKYPESINIMKNKSN